MLVPEAYWQSSAFLCQDDVNGRRVPKGTAFFVCVPVGTISRYREVAYVVTAGHNVQMARASRHPLFLRLNRTDGTVEDIEIPDDDWIESGDTDLAVCRFPMPPGNHYTITWLNPNQLATDEVATEKRIGPGDEVFFCGLFTEHAGRAGSQPIVRWGNVSMMPGEKVRVETPDGGTRLIDAYLVEARSWGGQSGSPAFVFFPPDRELGFLDLPSWRDDRLDWKALPLLLGVVQGHFDIKQDVTFKSGFDDEASVPVNAGIAVVIPAQKILEVLEEDVLVRDRESVARELTDEKSAATPDFKADRKPSEFTRFEELARKLTNTPKEEIDEQRRGEET